ncbi:MAG TPA: hypothetical protein VI197_16395 [Polyangiaceae bacterium]
MDEARTLLGVDQGTGADEVRRAYLRLVKKHRPEQDPGGFQRVREAYDIVRQALPYQVHALVTANGKAVVASPTEGAAEVTADELEIFYRRSDALEASDSNGAIEIWRAAVLQHPDNAEAHERLVEAYDAAGDEERAGGALLRGYQCGFSGFERELLARAPAHAPAELYERAEHDAGLAFAAAAGRLRQGDPRAALPYLRLGIKSASGSSYQTAALVIETLSRLGKHGDVEGFMELAELFANHVKDNQVALWAPHAAQWAVLRELRGVASDLPAFVFISLASSVVEQDAKNLAEELARYAARDWHQAQRAENVLKARAPRLHEAYAGLLRPAEHVPYGWGFEWGSVVGPLLVVVFMLARCLTGSRESETALPDPPKSLAGEQPIPQFATQPGTQYYAAYRTIDDLSGLAHQRGLGELRAKLVAVGHAFPEGCPSLAREMQGVVELARNQGSVITNHTKALWVEFERVCPARAGIGDPP